MAFTPTTWVDGTTAITATELNRIETGIDDAHAGSLDAGAIDTPQIADEAVTEAKLAFLAVTELKLAAGAVTATRIANGGVTNDKIGASAVTEAKIGAGAVTPAKTSFLPQLAATGKIFSGSINLAGTGGTLPSGWSSAATSTGVRTLTHNLGTTAYSIVATSASLTGNATFFSKGANTVQLRVHDGGSLADAEIDFILIQYA